MSGGFGCAAWARAHASSRGLRLGWLPQAFARLAPMRIASRHMPHFERRSPPGVAWLLVAGLAAAVVHFAASRPVAFLAVSSAVAVLFLLAYRRAGQERRQLRALASAREGQTICEFARDFDVREVDTWVVRAVYEQLQGHLAHAHPSFPLRADDRLKEDLRLDDEDLDMDIVQEIACRTRRCLDASAANPYFGRVRTARDLVLFFQHQPRSGNAAIRLRPAGIAR